MLSSGCRVVPFAHRRPCYAPSLVAPLTYVVVTCASLALSLFVRRPLSLGTPLTPPCLLGHTCRGASGLPRSSQRHPRAWPVLMVLARRGSPPAPTPTAGIDWPNLPSPMLHTYVSSVLDVSFVYCNYFILMCKRRSEDVAHVVYVAGVSEAYCKRLFKMFHLFTDVCCNLFLSGCCICFTHMLQQYVSNVLVVSVLCCSKWFRVASCKSGCFVCLRHMCNCVFQIFHLLSDVCCTQMFFRLQMFYAIQSGASGLGTRRAGGPTDGTARG
jgi:hypothetical protein